MTSKEYEKFNKVFDGTHAVLFDCAPQLPGAAIGIWRGFFKLESKQFIDEMWASIDFIRDRKIVTMISDHSDLMVVTDDVLKWLHENWYPNAAKHGLRIEAALSSKSATANLSLKRMLDEAKTGTVSTPTFLDLHAAYSFCTQFLKEYAQS